MRNQDWKLKYQDLKLKFHDAVDVAFRLGYEAGAQGAQLQQVQQDQAAAEQQAAMGQDGQLSGDSGQFGQDGSELDQHIGTLEGMLGQAKPGSIEQEGLKKSLNEIKAIKSNMKQKYELRKSEEAIKAIGKSVKPPFTLSKTATNNLSDHGKKALNDQEKIVDDLMKSFEEEEKKATESITKTLDFEQILKG